MVLESLINPKKAERKPWEMFFVGLFYSSLAILLSFWVFKGYVSLVMVFLTVFACTYLMIGTMILEEEKSKTIDDEKILIKEHGKALSFFIFLFLGFVVSFSLWYVFLPVNVTADAFSVQIETINKINTGSTGQAISTTNILMTIFFNNMKVLLFSMLFAFFYGAGAIFILSWNASVIGAAIGNFIKGVVGSGVFAAFSFGFLRYLTHGIIEIAAYFVGGLAAGIISVAVINHDFGSKRFKHILGDSVDLAVVAVVLLLIAALVEVYVTPMFF